MSGLSGRDCGGWGGGQGGMEAMGTSNYPLPWTWAGSTQDGPRRLQERLGEPKMSSKMAQDSLRYLKIDMKRPAPRGPKTAPRRLQEAKSFNT